MELVSVAASHYQHVTRNSPCAFIGGSGKTVFCSSVIKNTMAACRLATYQRARDSLAYFFCTAHNVHNEAVNTTEHNFSRFLRNALTQLCPPNHVFEELQELYDNCTRHHPARPATNEELQQVLIRVIERLGQESIPTNGDRIQPGETYMIIDGLDGMPLYKLNNWLKFITDVVSLNLPHFHLLVAHRNGNNIRIPLESLGGWSKIACNRRSLGGTMKSYFDRYIKDDIHLQVLHKAQRTEIVDRLLKYPR